MTSEGDGASEAGQRCDDVIEAFLQEDCLAEPERVREWIRRHPDCRGALLMVAGHLAEATLIGSRRTISAEERAEIRRWAAARVDAIHLQSAAHQRLDSTETP